MSFKAGRLLVNDFIPVGLLVRQSPVNLPPSSNRRLVLHLALPGRISIDLL